MQHEVVMGASSDYQCFGTQIVNIRVFPRPPTWCEDIDQLSSCYGPEEDADGGELLMSPEKCNYPGGRRQYNRQGHQNSAMNKDIRDHQANEPIRKRQNPQLLRDYQYRPHNPRRSE